ncbi:MAG: hypothetical protein ACK5RS_14125, partial [Acidobacteriota bacterium]
HNSPSAEGNTPGKGETTRRGKRGRRQFLTGVGGALAAGVASGAVLTERVEAAPVVSDESIRGVAGLERAEGAYRTRVTAALNQRSQPIVQHLTNGD